MKTTVLASMIATLCAFGQDQPRVYFKTGGVQVVGAQPINGGSVKGAPYSAEAVTETTQTLADGNRIVNRQSSMQYRDGMGRERHEQTLMMVPAEAKAGPEIVMISDPIANVSYSLNTREHSAQKMPDSGTPKVKTAFFAGTPVALNVSGLKATARIILNGSAASEADKPEDLGSQLVEGVLANGTRVVHTIPAGQIGNERPIQVTDETWYSPELQITVMSRHSDPREGETVYKLNNVTRAEPDPSLFRVPTDYVINDFGPILKLKE
jgi:hypothetical protein